MIPKPAYECDRQHSFAVRGKILPATDMRPRRLRVAIEAPPMHKSIVALTHDCETLEQVRLALQAAASQYIVARFREDKSAEAVCILQQIFVPDPTEYVLAVNIGLSYGNKQDEVL